MSVIDDLSPGHRSAVPFGADLWVGDVCDDRLMGQVLRGAQGCFHLAAIASVDAYRSDPTRARRINRAGTNSVLRSASEAGGIPIVWVSSAAVYGRQSRMPIRECDRLDPISAYGEDKLANEHDAQSAVHRLNLPNTALRLFNLYGHTRSPNLSCTGVIAKFLDCLWTDAPLRIFGDGLHVRDFIHVADVVQAFLRSMWQLHTTKAKRFRAFNVCNGRGTNVLELATILGNITGKVPQMVFAPERREDIANSVGDIRKFEVILPRSERIELEDGLRALVAQRGCWSKIRAV